MRIDDIPQRDPKGRLAGKVAVIAGAGSAGEGWSNGSAVAALFAREGATVFAIDRSLEAAEKVRAIVRGLNVDCLTGVADVTRLDEVERAVARCVDAYGRIDILYNNVGAGSVGGVVETTEQKWHETLNLNLSSAFYTSKCVLPIMQRQRSGSLIHLSSIAAVSYLKETMAAYSAAKAGLLQLSRVIALQHIGQGIRSNCVIAGSVETAEIRRRAAVRFGADRVPEVMAIRDSVLPTGKSGTVWDVAFAVLYLASDEAKYVTATELLVDGAYSAAQCESYLDKVPAAAST